MSQIFNDLVRMVAQLRSPEGCPWDWEQTHESLKSCLLEETYEVLDALDRRDPQHLREELGDLLLQILLHARIECEQNNFGIEDVIADLTRKLIRRHPHVFSPRTHASPTLNAKQVVNQWEAIKRAERSTQHGPDSILASILSSLPSLLRTSQIQQRVSRVGFDWETLEQVQEKLNEELEELRMETIRAPQAPEPHSAVQHPKTHAALEHEFGDVLFTMANFARFLHINPEEALRKANERFLSRFQCMERRAAQEGKPLQELTASEWDVFWQVAKRQERLDSPPSSSPPTSQAHE